MSKSAAAGSSARPSKRPQDARLDAVLPLIDGAKDEGITVKELTAQILGATKPPPALNAKLKALVTEGAIRGPFKHALPPKKTADDYYFAEGYGPSAETVCVKVAHLVQEAGSTPTLAKQLQREITGIEGVFLKAAIQRALDARAIRGPYKSGKDQCYFPIDAGPTVENVSQKVLALAKKAGCSPPSEAILKKELRGVEVLFLKDAIQLAVERHAVLALKCGKTLFYLHADMTAKPAEVAARPPLAELALEDILPAYRRIKTRQSGRSTVKIYDLLQELQDRQIPKEAVHKLLIEEGRKGRVSNHHASVQLPDKVVEAGFRLPDFEEPFVTFTVRSEQ